VKGPSLLPQPGACREFEIISVIHCLMYWTVVDAHAPLSFDWPGLHKSEHIGPVLRLQALDERIIQFVFVGVAARHF
jgi:hypothetical protein